MGKRGSLYEVAKQVMGDMNPTNGKKVVKHHWASHIKHSSLGEKYVKVDSHSLKEDGEVTEFYVTHNGKSITIPRSEVTEMIVKEHSHKMPWKILDNLSRKKKR